MKRPSPSELETVHDLALGAHVRVQRLQRALVVAIAGLVIAVLILLSR
jgi:hypothetical protein